jgi:DNA-nicking Smr family endonuclease
MAKKNKRPSETSFSLDQKFSTDAFASLKSLQARHKADAEEQREQEARKAAEAKAKEAARAREEAALARDFRFTEADLTDKSGLSDEEIFEASMAAMNDVDIYQSKFNAKDLPPKSTKEPEKAPLTMTDEEREFAIFTQEMAISNVKRLSGPVKQPHKTRNKRKYAQTAEALENFSPVNVELSAAQTAPGMKTDFVAPEVSVTQIEKGDDILERPDMADAMTTAQKQLLRDIKRYEARYGIIITLKLRGMTLNAAMSRLDDFISACIRDKKPYALIICGKGLHSENTPVIKEGTMDALRSDKRIVEYAPVLNADGDFGSIYVSFKKIV